MPWMGRAQVFASLERVIHQRQLISMHRVFMLHVPVLRMERAHVFTALERVMYQCSTTVHQFSTYKSNTSIISSVSRVHRLALLSHVSPTIPIPTIPTIPTIPRLVSTAAHDMCQIVGHEMSCHLHEPRTTTFRGITMPSPCLGACVPTFMHVPVPHSLVLSKLYQRENAKASSNQCIDWRRAFPAQCQWYHARVHSIAYTIPEHTQRTLRAGALSTMRRVFSQSLQNPDNASRVRMSHCSPAATAVPKRRRKVR